MRIFKLLRTHFLYESFELRTRFLGNILALLLYFGLIIFSISQRSYFIERSNYDNITIASFIYFIIIIRMITGGMSSPYNVIEKEVNKHKLYHKYTLIRYGCENLIFLRISSKIIKSLLINSITTLGLLFSLNLIYDISNYLILFFPLLIGMFSVSVIGYLVAIIGIVLDLKREMVSFIQIIIVVVFLQVKSFNLLFPFSVIRSEINGIITSDIVFAEVYKNNLSTVGYLIVTFILSLALCYGILYILGIVLRYKKIKGDYFQHEIDTK